MSRLDEKLRLPDRGEREAKNALARLWSRIMTKIKLSPSRVEENNRAYVRNPLNQIPNESGKRSSACGNIRKEIERPTLTWRGFEKLIRWSRPKSAKIVAVIEWKDGVKTIDEIAIRIDDYEAMHDHEDKPIAEYSNDELFAELKARGVDYIIPGHTIVEEED